MAWKRYNGTEIKEEITEEIERTITSEIKIGHQLSICVGTDSQVKGDQTEFATVIVFLRKRQGGFMFINKEKSSQKMSLKERMIQEVSKSVTIAYSIAPVLEKYNINLEVHADINEDPGHKSHVAFRDAMGYILGMGFEFKAKPNAFASSYCADKMI